MFVVELTSVQATLTVFSSGTLARGNATAGSAPAAITTPATSVSISDPGDPTCLINPVASFSVITSVARHRNSSPPSPCRSARAIASGCPVTTFLDSRRSSVPNTRTWTEVER